MYRTAKNVVWPKFTLIFIISASIISWVNGTESIGNVIIGSVNNNNNCWTNDAECVVQAILHKTAAGGSTEQIMRESLPLEIDCMHENNERSNVVTSPPEYILKRFERAFNVELNGCRKGFKWQTFGFEFLPNCNKIIEMKITKFHADALYELHCPSATYIPMEILRFEHNEIATITTEALSKLSLLKELYFQSNSLRHVERGAFDNLHFTEHINIESEPLLAIKDATIFQSTHVADLRLCGLKYVTSALFEKLPQTLREIYVEKTAINMGGNIDEAATEPASAAATNDRKVNINNSGIIRNISIIECALRGFHLNDDHGSVQFLNLSGNSIEDFNLTINGTKIGNMDIKILDLSNNKLNHLSMEWLTILNNLEKLYLSHNQLTTLPLMPLLRSLSKVQNIDLRSNQLEYLIETKPNSLQTDTLYRVLIHIDNNPWNCKWLLSFAHTHPELFRIFHYEKFLSQINVNGLECVPEEPKMLTKKPFNLTALLIAERNGSLIPLSGDDVSQERLNVSAFTVIYGNPYDLKRNQRAEALIIIFMLPVGIALLFILLYLWIYCQKVFHLSFYRKCSLCKRRKNLNATTRLVANRFDVVRQVPPPPTSGLTTAATTTTTINNNEGYELPLNGIAPICNCVHHNSNLTDNIENISNEKCDKIHHITYVPLPNEEPQKIYEEIIGGEEEETEDNENDEGKKNVSHVNTIYDHLEFE